MKRRTVLTAMLGLPVFGAAGLWLQEDETAAPYRRSSCGTFTHEAGGGECTGTDRFAGRRTVDGLYGAGC